MDYGSMLGDSFDYTKEALMEKWVKWILLILPFMAHGYSVQIFRGLKPAPEVADWIATFIDGIKLAIITFIYFIPVIIIAMISFLSLIFAVISAIALGDTSSVMNEAGSRIALIGAGAGIALIGILVCILLAIIVYLILPIAFVRFSRTENFVEAFNFSGILGHIGRIGWGSYIIAFVVLLIAAAVFVIIMGIVGFILAFIPFLGGILFFILKLILIPPVVIFVARYFTQVYDSVG